MHRTDTTLALYKPRLSIIRINPGREMMQEIHGFIYLRTYIWGALIILLSQTPTPRQDIASAQVGPWHRTLQG
jgi:hypothetical protein